MRFERDRWYSGENRKAIRQRAYQASSGTRRIISLVFLLAMILVVMQQLNNPSKYEPAFRSIGLLPPTNHSAAEEQKVSLKIPESHNENGLVRGRLISLTDGWQNLSLSASTSEIDTYIQMWEILLEDASPEVVNEIGERFFLDQRTNSFVHDKSKGLEEALTDAKVSDLEVVSEAARKWLQHSSDRVREWLTISREESHGTPIGEAEAVAGEEAELEIFQTQWMAWAALSEGGVASAAAALNNDMREGLRAALDRMLIKQVRDGSPWRPIERSALLRTFERAMFVGEYFTQMNNHEPLELKRELQSIKRIEVPQLTKQASELRGRLVRMSGRPISNVTPSEAKSDRWGNFLYDVLWMYPDDNSEQPVCLYALKSWKHWAQMFLNPQGPTSAPMNGWPRISDDRVGKTSANMDSVEVTGFFLKRLAYASPRGVDVAPILVVCHSRWIGEVDNSTSQATPLSENSSSDKLNQAKNETLSIAVLSANSSPIKRWREPGVYLKQLKLLNDVFGESLKGISALSLENVIRPNASGISADENDDGKLSKEMEAIRQVQYQLPRLASSIQSAIDSGGKVGPATLTRIEGIATECITIPARSPITSPLEETVVYRLAIQPKPELWNEPENDLSKEDVDASKTIYAIVNSVPAQWLRESNEAGSASSQQNLLSASELHTAKIYQPVVLDGFLLHFQNESDKQASESIDVADSPATTERIGSGRLFLCDAPEWSWGSMEPESFSFEKLAEKLNGPLQPSIPIDWQQLAAAGWDLSALRFVKSLRGKPMASEEKEAFYTLMKAADNLADKRLFPDVPTITAMQSLKSGPESQLGRVATKIRIVRVTKIDVPEETNRAFLGGTEFYELDGLADIGRQVIQLKNPEGDGEIRFAGQFPMTLIAKSVPDWLLVGEAKGDSDKKDQSAVEPSLQQGVWYPATNIQIEGVFYRLWSYSTGQTSQASETIAGPEIRQIGPLVAVTKWNSLWDNSATAKPPQRSIFRELFTAAVLALGVIWFFYRFQFGQSRSKRK